MKFTRKRRANASILPLLFTWCHGFAPRPGFLRYSRLSIFAPPGSGYQTPEDEPNMLPDTYEPMMEYPGTMRPGRCPENMPFHDLPIADSDPDPVPWPHFQQLEWHHRWDPPHPHPIPMELFIEMNGRWATAEDEAAMRAGARRDVRQRREIAEQERQSMLIVDDEEDATDDSDLPIELGEGVFGSLGSGSEEAMTAAAVKQKPGDDTTIGDDVEVTEDDFDDFLLDLGLDSNDEDVRVSPFDSSPKSDTSKLLDAMSSMMDNEDEDGNLDLDLDLGLLDDLEEDTVDVTMDTDDNEDLDDASAVAALSEDEDLDIGLEDGDDDFTSDDGMTMVPLDDFGDDSLLDDDDAFNDGGFDYDSGDMSDMNDGGWD